MHAAIRIIVSLVAIGLAWLAVVKRPNADGWYLWWKFLIAEVGLILWISNSWLVAVFVYGGRFRPVRLIAMAAFVVFGVWNLTRHCIYYYSAYVIDPTNPSVIALSTKYGMPICPDPSQCGVWADLYVNLMTPSWAWDAIFVFVIVCIWMAVEGPTKRGGLSISATALAITATIALGVDTTLPVWLEWMYHRECNERDRLRLRAAGNSDTNGHSDSNGTSNGHSNGHANGYSTHSKTAVGSSSALISGVYFSIAVIAVCMWIPGFYEWSVQRGTISGQLTDGLVSISGARSTIIVLSTWASLCLYLLKDVCTQSFGVSVSAGTGLKQSLADWTIRVLFLWAFTLHVAAATAIALIYRLSAPNQSFVDSVNAPPGNGSPPQRRRSALHEAAMEAAANAVNH